MYLLIHAGMKIKPGLWKRPQVIKQHMPPQPEPDTATHMRIEMYLDHVWIDLLPILFANEKSLRQQIFLKARTMINCTDDQLY